MQRTDGIRIPLSSAPIYSLFQRVIGAEGSRRWLVNQLPELRGPSKIVDVGCGPGDLVPFLSAQVEYVGFDISEEYIRKARAKFGDRPSTTFLCGSAQSVFDDPRAQGADVVLHHGVLHHLDDDEVIDSFRFAWHVLRPGGRTLALEPCHSAGQGLMSRLVMGLDRGENIRSEQEWAHLLSSVFKTHRARPVRGLIRIPYVHVILEGFRPVQE